MKRRVRAASALWLALGLAGGVGAEGARDLAPAAAMPRTGDHTLLSWREGPPYGTNARYSSERRWLRLETGHFAAEFDAEKITITGFASWARPRDEARATTEALAAAPLPPAQLHLVVRVGAAVYTCTGRRPLAFDSHGLPAAPLEFPVRVIESGRFFQKFALHDLEFRDHAGRRLPATARLEIAAWPERLALTLIVRPEVRLEAAQVFLRLQSGGGRDASAVEAATDWEAAVDHRSILSLDAEGNAVAPVAPGGVVVRVAPVDPGGRAAVDWDRADFCHRVRLEAPPWPAPAEGVYPESMLDAWEAYDLMLENQTAEPQCVALKFEHVPAKAITGFVPLLLDADGRPTGLPIQISKNWHLARPGTQLPHAGAWIHGRALLWLEPGSRLALRHGTTFARWGGMPTASLAQLSLVGWGHNGFWEQMALGSFGETFCFQPGRAMRRALLTDFRPLLQRGFARDERWAWPANLGGGDTMVRHDPRGRYVPFKRNVTRHRSSGPNLAHLEYDEVSADEAVHSRVEVLLPQTDDLARVYLNIRYEVRRPVEFSRLVLLQLGADFYNDCAAPALAWGTAAGLVAEHRPARPPAALPQWEARGEAAWVSLHGQARADAARSGQGSRGLVVREWRATLGGRPVPAPWFAASRGAAPRLPLGAKILPPPGLRHLVPGDRVEMLVALLAVPLTAERYYGPDEGLRAALAGGANTWRPVQREAAANRPVLEMAPGTLLRGFPLSVPWDPGREITLTLRGGLGRVPLRLTGLPRPGAATLVRADPSRRGDAGGDGEEVAYWQSDYDVATQRWTVTYTLPAGAPEAAFVVRPARRPVEARR